MGKQSGEKMSGAKPWIIRCRLCMKRIETITFNASKDMKRTTLFNRLGRAIVAGFCIAMLLGAGQHLEQGRLARAVGADQPGAFTLEQAEGESLEQRPDAEALG